MWLHQSGLWELLRCVLLRENGTRLGEFSYQEGFSSLFTLMCKLPGTWGSSALAQCWGGRKLLSKALGLLIPGSLPWTAIYCIFIDKRKTPRPWSHTRTPPLEKKKITHADRERHRLSLCCISTGIIKKIKKTCWLMVQLQEMSSVSQLEHPFSSWTVWHLHETFFSFCMTDVRITASKIRMLLTTCGKWSPTASFACERLIQINPPEESLAVT